MEEQLSPDQKGDPRNGLGPVLDRLILASSEGLSLPETEELEVLHRKAVEAYADGLAEARETKAPFDRARAAALPDLLRLWEAQHASLFDWMAVNRRVLTGLPKQAEKLDTQLTAMKLPTFTELYNFDILEPGNNVLFGLVGNEKKTPMPLVGNAHRILLPTLAQILALTSGEEPNQYQELQTQVEGLVHALGATASGTFIPNPHHFGTREAAMRQAYGGGKMVRVFDPRQFQDGPLIVALHDIYPTFDQIGRDIYGINPNLPSKGGVSRILRSYVFIPDAVGISFLPKPDGEGKYFAHPIGHPPLKAEYLF